MKVFYVYVLYSKNHDKFYIGYTGDLKQRIQDHKDNRVKTTEKFGDCKLVYYETCLSRKDATIREKQLKTGYGRAYLRNRLKHYLEFRAHSSAG